MVASGFVAAADVEDEGYSVDAFVAAQALAEPHKVHTQLSAMATDIDAFAVEFESESVA